MSKPQLEACPFFGPAPDDDPSRVQRSLPEDYATNPFKYLPPEITLSPSELELASKYENGDFSGGYVASQVAWFRRPKSAQRHRARRERFRRLKNAADASGLALPEAFVTLVETDAFVNRLRHNSIWLQLADELVSLPADPTQSLFLIFGEGQGCGYWHLLLAPDDEHVVAFSEHAFGLKDLYPSGQEPDPASFEVYQCADSFAAWIVNYFAECIEGDRHYDEMLATYPGM